MVWLMFYSTMLLKPPYNLTADLRIPAAWSGFVSETDNNGNRLQSVIKKAKRFRYLPASFCNFGELFRADADENLFFAVRYNPHHVLHTLLPSAKTSSTYNLRPRSHNAFPATSLPLLVKIS